jgi:hypothetical protein
MTLSDALNRLFMARVGGPEADGEGAPMVVDALVQEAMRCVWDAIMLITHERRHRNIVGPMGTLCEPEELASEVFMSVLEGPIANIFETEGESFYWLRQRIRWRSIDWCRRMKYIVYTSEPKYENEIDKMLDQYVVSPEDECIMLQSASQPLPTGNGAVALPGMAWMTPSPATSDANRVSAKDGIPKPVTPGEMIQVRLEQLRQLVDVVGPEALRSDAVARLQTSLVGLYEMQDRQLTPTEFGNRYMPGAPLMAVHQNITRQRNYLLRVLDEARGMAERKRLPAELSYLTVDHVEMLIRFAEALRIRARAHN